MAQHLDIDDVLIPRQSFRLLRRNDAFHRHGAPSSRTPKAVPEEAAENVLFYLPTGPRQTAARALECPFPRNSEEARRQVLALSAGLLEPITATQNWQLRLKEMRGRGSVSFWFRE